MNPRLRLPFSERFLLLRRRNRWTQARLGELLGVSARTVMRIERGGHIPNKPTLGKFEILESRWKKKHPSQV